MIGSLLSISLVKYTRLPSSSLKQTPTTDEFENNQEIKIWKIEHIYMYIYVETSSSGIPNFRASRELRENREMYGLASRKHTSRIFHSRDSMLP